MLRVSKKLLKNGLLLMDFNPLIFSGKRTENAMYRGGTFVQRLIKVAGNHVARLNLF